MFSFYYILISALYLITWAIVAGTAAFATSIWYFRSNLTGDSIKDLSLLISISAITAAGIFLSHLPAYHTVMKIAIHARTHWHWPLPYPRKLFILTLMTLYLIIITLYLYRLSLLDEFDLPL